MVAAHTLSIKRYSMAMRLTRVDTSAWMPGLEAAVMDAAMSGGVCRQGARAALYNHEVADERAADG